MARINVEQKALLDRRFAVLGGLLLAPRKWRHAAGLWAAIQVWDQCQERGSYTLSKAQLEAINKGLSEAIVGSELAELMDGGEIRIRGTQGRVEWLNRRREDGLKGGRPGNPRVNPRVIHNDTEPQNPTLNPRGRRKVDPPSPPLALSLPDPDSVSSGSLARDPTETSTPELPQTALRGTAPPLEPVLTVPCTGGAAFPVTESDVTAWTEAFPAVDVLQQLRAAVAWIDANFEKRKTRRGCKAFLVRWLSKQQNEAGRSQPKARVPPQTEAGERWLKNPPRW